MASWDRGTTPQIWGRIKTHEMLSNRWVVMSSQPRILPASSAESGDPKSMNAKMEYRNRPSGLGLDLVSVFAWSLRSKLMS